MLRGRPARPAGAAAAAASPLLVVLLLCRAAAPAASLHYIGCHYEDLCEDTEHCASDGAFGRCVPSYTSPEQLPSMRLSPDDLADLATMLETLVAQGHRWSHIYTQCVLQTKLLALQTGETLDGGVCELVNGRPAGWLPGSRGVPALPLADNDDNDDDKTVAQLQTYDANDGEGHAIFTPDEQAPRKAHAPDTYRRLDEALVLDDDRQNAPPLELLWPAEDRNLDEGAAARPFAAIPAQHSDPIMKRTPASDRQLLGTADQLHQLLQLVDEVETLAEVQAVQRLLDRQRGWSADREEEGRPPAADEGALASLERAAAAERRRQAALPADYDDDGDGPASADYLDWYDAAPIPLSVRSDPEFRRAERLDIKKPGPWFGVNNFAFDYDFDGKAPTLDEFRALDRLPVEPMEPTATEEPEPGAEDGAAVEDGQEPAPADPALAVADESRRVDAVATDDVTAPSDVIPMEQATLPPEPAQTLTKLEERADAGDMARGGDKFARYSDPRDGGGDKFARYPDPRDAIDASYVFVRVEKPFQRWKDGQLLVEKIEESLALPLHTLDDIRVKGDLVTFRVNPNRLGYNSSTIVAKMGNVRAPLESRLGVSMVETGQGDGSGDGAASVLLAPAPHSLLIQTLSIVLGVLAAVVLLVVVVVFALRRSGNSAKDKAKQLANTDAEAASKDYQDLCRSRMAARVSEKEQSDKPQRVHSLSKESDGTASPTSRSSTSSWSEEPVTSNMDISTGHMVLSYMEDHLKRKDKLEQEWRALCAYEAEPSARTVALLPDNRDKNRTQEVLPYDHARVSLNAVTNATGGSYINASSITDHDPRNPAYVATQGPLQTTANDFWQMVWEQGSVVIVMLTRLTENGVSMCHRYWPEEGSELYHIYEVHLVSEHIWCDEYLVRSFYLKNLKTSETRTVTQFHFLAWPDNGVPTSTKALLEFRRKVNKSYRGRSCPVIVHCSDGAGRTGTYCLIDLVLNRMSKGAKEIDIAASLEHIRDQRPTMVHTRAQFEFVLMAVAEEVHAILKALPQ